MSEIKIRLHLFTYNYFRRHWLNFLTKRRWIAAGLDPSRFPKGGKITREAYEWALRAAKDLDPDG